MEDVADIFLVGLAILVAIAFTVGVPLLPFLVLGRLAGRGHADSQTGRRPGRG